MHLSRHAKKRVAIAAVVLAVVTTLVLVGAGIKLWQDGSAAAPPVAQGKNPNSAAGVGVFDRSTMDSSVDRDGSKKGKGDAIPDPFAASYGANKMYKVVLRVKSDGAASVGFRYRDGKAEGQQVINRTLTLSRSVRGPLPVAQIGVQVLSNATYATCEIHIDGVKVTSYAARKPGYVAVCTN